MPMIHRSSIALALVAAAVTAQAAELTPETTEAWDQYVHTVDARMKMRLDGRKPFLWLDEDPSNMQSAREGEVVVSPVGAAGWEAVPHGLIHDWQAGAFIPGATLHDVLSVVQDYDRYKDFYRPVVDSMRLPGPSGGEDRFRMIWREKVLFVTAALESEYASSYVHVTENRCYSVASTTHVREIRNYGRPAETKLPEGQGSGYLWRVYSVARYEERDGGVYVEIEAVGLSRDIPASLSWLVAPVVARLSRDSVAASLRQTRDAVRSASDVWSPAMAAR